MEARESRRTLRIELLDGLRVRRGEEVITRFRTHKTAALLAYLALFPERAHTRESLAELLWPDCSEPHARHSLSNALYALRMQLAPDVGVGDALFLSDRNTIRLNPQAFTSDVAEFAAARREARQADSPQRRAEALTRALHLYRGELLRGMYEEWIFPEQAQLGSHYLRMLAELIGYHETSGDFELAIEYALRAVQEDPLCEVARHRLMRLYGQAGQNTVAINHFHDLERQLRRELDASPGPELRELLEQLRTTSPSNQAPTIPNFLAAPQQPLCPEPDQAEPSVPEPTLAGPGHAEPGCSQRTGEGRGDPKASSGGSHRADALETVGGAVPLTSRLYVDRSTDAEFRGAIARRESIVLVKGPRQTGKTSLLARGLQQARDAGSRVALTDLQTLTDGELGSAEEFLLALAESLADQLDLETRPRSWWDPDRGPALNLRRFLRREIFTSGAEPLVWGLDEVDRLFTTSFGSGVFGMFRSWHNERALDPQGPWSRLTLVLAHATEAHLHISDLSQSPFNVGLRLELQDFTRQQVADLNALYGAPLAPSELDRFFDLVGGHPYLVRRGLHEMVRRGLGLTALLEIAEPSVGVFGDHMRRLILLLAADRELSHCLQQLLQEGSCPGEGSFYRLRSAGILAGDNAGEVRWRCKLYEQVLRGHFLTPGVTTREP